MDDIGITFRGHFYKLQTLADGGIRVAFDVSISDLQNVVKLPGLSGQALQLAIVPMPAESAERGPW